MCGCAYLIRFSLFFSLLWFVWLYLVGAGSYCPLVCLCCCCWGAGGLSPLVPGRPLRYGRGGSASSAVFRVDTWLSLRWASRVLCSVGAAGGLGLVALSACFWLLGGWILALLTYTLITKHGYQVGPVPCVLHVHAHTHTFISPAACSLSSFCVVLWFDVIHIHSCVVCDCCYLWVFFVCLCVCLFVFSLLVCFQVLLVALRLDPPQSQWIVFCFVFTGVAAGCLVFHCFYFSISVPFLFLFSSSFPVPRSGSALLHVKYCNKNK